MWRNVSEQERGKWFAFQTIRCSKDEKRTSVYRYVGRPIDTDRIWWIDACFCGMCWHDTDGCVRSRTATVRSGDAPSSNDVCRYTVTRSIERLAGSGICRAIPFCHVHYGRFTLERHSGRRHRLCSTIIARDDESRPARSDGREFCRTSSRTVRKPLDRAMKRLTRWFY